MYLIRCPYPKYINRASLVVQWIRLPACQYGRHRFDSWSGKIPQVSEQLTRVPQLLSLSSSLCAPQLLSCVVQLRKPSCLEPGLGNRSDYDEKLPITAKRRPRAPQPAEVHTKQWRLTTEIDTKCKYMYKELYLNLHLFIFPVYTPLHISKKKKNLI